MASGGEDLTGEGRDVLRYVRLLPVVLLVGGFLVDYLTPAQFSATAFYSVAPMLAAPLMSLPGTVLGRHAGPLDISTLALLDAPSLSHPAPTLLP